jgi:tetratricopeptide (TPR) repeat protein
MHDVELKSLKGHDLASALDKANVYRALNQPEEAESICEDILAVDSKHQGALKTLGLAVTDRFSEQRVSLFDRALEIFEKLESEYDRVYHQGIAWERLGKAHLSRNEGLGALTSFEHALEHYEKAESLGAKDAADPILRWNRCVRLITTHRLLKEAAAAPHSREPHLGD